MQFVRVERATQAPSKCFLCGRNDGPMIDTGLRERLPWGRIYICLTSCVPDLIRIDEGLTSNAARQVVRGSADRRRDLERAEAEIRRLQPFERAIANARASLGVGGDSDLARAR